MSSPFLTARVEPFYINEKDEVRVEILLEEHVDRFLETLDAAFKEDPLTKYTSETPDAKKPGPLKRKLRNRILKASFRQRIRRSIAYTVNGGDAFIFANPPPSEAARPSPFDRFMERLLLAADLALRSKEQRKRLKELQTKSEAVKKACLGADSTSMIYIAALGTHPDFQGRGYGSALVDTITFMADIKGRTTYLYSSGPHNVPFYESVGFTSVGEARLGTDNPTYSGPPIVLPLMVRKPTQRLDEDF